MVSGTLALQHYEIKQNEFDVKLPIGACSRRSLSKNRLLPVVTYVYRLAYLGCPCVCIRMVLTKRKSYWSDTDLALNDTKSNHERSKLNEVTGVLEQELKVFRSRTKPVRHRVLTFF